MFNMKVMMFLLLLLFSLGEAAPRTTCRWTQFQLTDLNKESIQLLEKMGGLMPLKCLNKGGRNFPNGLFSDAQDVDLVLLSLETFKGVTQIFKNDQTNRPVSWNVDQLRLFRNIVSRQVENLQQCAEQTAVPGPAGGTTAEVRSYFRNLEDRLKEKGLDECAWEMVRDEVHHTLSKFRDFLQSGKK